MTLKSGAGSRVIERGVEGWREGGREGGREEALTSVVLQGRVSATVAKEGGREGGWEGRKGTTKGKKGWRELKKGRTREGGREGALTSMILHSWIGPTVAEEGLDCFILKGGREGGRMEGAYLGGSSRSGQPRRCEARS